MASDKINDKIRAAYYLGLMPEPDFGNDIDALKEDINAVGHIAIEKGKHFDDVIIEEEITELTERIKDPKRKSRAQEDPDWDNIGC